MATAKQMQKIMSEYVKKHFDVFFIEIGAYDGKTNDPLFALVKSHKWQGVLVEPQDNQFERLKENYGDFQGLHFEKLAIAEHDTVKVFYGVRSTDYDSNTHGQLNSFNKDVILKHRHLVKNLDDRVYETKVRCLSFGSILKKYNVTKLDVLSIDTEGYDYKIIRQIDFSKIKPALIHFEHKHLSLADQKNCFSYLETNGYEILNGRFNSLAYIKS